MTDKTTNPGENIRALPTPPADPHAATRDAIAEHGETSGLLMQAIGAEYAALVAVGVAPGPAAVIIGTRWAISS